MPRSYQVGLVGQYLTEKMKNNLLNLSLRLRALTVFRELLSDPVISALSDCISTAASDSAEAAVSAYSEFVSCLYNSGYVNLSLYILNAINNSENIFIRSVAVSKKMSQILISAVDEELKTLGEIAELTPEKLREITEWDGFLPAWETESIDFISLYHHRAENIEKYGFGRYAGYHMFYINGDKKIVPVRNPDTTRLSDLIGYSREKNVIINNTKALLSGKPAANILITGDAGTGKSSTVKAVGNELYSEGLRILEVRKEQLMEIPSILDELTENPLKFILFIDDLSFVKDDDNFSALKAILEGSVSAKSKNVVIYATSNRRHLVKEKFSDRDGDDVHLNDTIQETVSLAERFGIHLTFKRPDKKEYLDIVRGLADNNDIVYSEEKLCAEAEKFALTKNARSPRAAKQFVESLISDCTQII